MEMKSADKFYEVFVQLMNHGKEIGMTCLQLKTSNKFMASVEAENIIEGRYGEDVLSHTLRVDSITEEEFLYVQAA